MTYKEQQALFQEKSKRRKRKIYGSEDQEQIALFSWASYARMRLPGLELMFAIPNGGLRDKAVAAKMKATGTRAGVPDIFLPVPRGSYHGLWIELKVGYNKPSDIQKWWLGNLEARGYAVAVCYGWGEAQEAITKYLKQE